MTPLREYRVIVPDTPSNRSVADSIPRLSLLTIQQHLQNRLNEYSLFKGVTVTEVPSHEGDCCCEKLIEEINPKCPIHNR